VFDTSLAGLLPGRVLEEGDVNVVHWKLDVSNNRPSDEAVLDTQHVREFL